MKFFFRRNSWILEKEKLLLLLLWSTEIYFDVCKKNLSSSFKRSKTLCYSVGWINRLYRSIDFSNEKFFTFSFIIYLIYLIIIDTYYRIHLLSSSLLCGNISHSPSSIPTSITHIMISNTFMYTPPLHREICCVCIIVFFGEKKTLALLLIILIC